MHTLSIIDAALIPPGVLFNKLNYFALKDQLTHSLTTQALSWLSRIQSNQLALLQQFSYQLRLHAFWWDNKAIKAWYCKYPA